MSYKLGANYKLNFDEALLQTLGIEAEGVRSYTIYCEAGKPPVLTLEKYVRPYKVNDKGELLLESKDFTVVELKAGDFVPSQHAEIDRHSIV